MRCVPMEAGDGSITCRVAFLVVVSDICDISGDEGVELSQNAVHREKLEYVTYTKISKLWRVRG